MRPTFVLLALLAHLGVHGLEEAEPPYSFRPFHQTGGLYFDRLLEIEFFQVEWRFVASVEVGKFLRQRPMPKFATPEFDYVRQNIPGASRRLKEMELFVNKKLQEIDRYSTLLQGHLGEFQEQGLRRSRRSAPFGFIGSLSHALFGTLTEEDAEYFNEELDKVYSSQNALASLLANQTHVVRSELQDIHSNLNVLNGRVRKLFNLTQVLVSDLKQVRSDVDRLSLQLNLDEWLESVERSVEEYLASVILLTDAVLFARQGILHPVLISPVYLVRAAEEVLLHTSKRLPFSREDLQTENLQRVSRLQIKGINGRLIIVLSVPLLEREEATLYQLIPYPEFQAFGTNATVAAFIRPQTAFLAVMGQNDKVLLPTPEYLAQCRPHAKKLICPTTLPLYSADNPAGCEGPLLLHPERVDWRLCDIRVTASRAAFWKPLNTANSWIYSLPTPAKITISCGDQLAGIETLKGAGILSLRAGCQALTGNALMRSLSTLTTSGTYVFEAGRPLNLTIIIPTTVTLHAEELLVKQSVEDDTEKTGDDWSISSRSLSLQEVEDRAKTIAHLHRSSRFSYISTGSFSFIVIIFICIGCVYLYCRCCRSQGKCSFARSAPAVSAIISSDTARVDNATPITFALPADGQGVSRSRTLPVVRYSARLPSSVPPRHHASLNFLDAQE